jgi:hypothetical protein
MFHRVLSRTYKKKEDFLSHFNNESQQGEDEKGLVLSNLSHSPGWETIKESRKTFFYKIYTFGVFILTWKIYHRNKSNIICPSKNKKSTLTLS